MLKKVFDKILLKNTPIRLRLLVFFVLLSTVPVIAVGFISFTLSLNNLKGNAIDFITQTVNQTSNEINDLFTKSEEIANLVGSDPIIQETLRNPLPEEKPRRYSEEIRLDSNLNFMNSYLIKDVFGIYVLGENGGQFKSNSLSFKSDDMRNVPFYTKTIASDKPIWFTSANGSSVVITASGSFFSLAIPVKDKLTGKNFGVVVIDLSEKMLMDKITKSQLGNKGYLFMTDNNEYLFSDMDKGNVPSIDEARITKEGKVSYFTSNKGIKYIVISNKTISGWNVVGLVSVNELQKESLSIALVIVFITLLVALLAVAVSFGVSSSVAKPIKKLMVLMKKAEKGDLTVQVNSDYSDEIGQLVRSYGHMTRKLNDLMHKIVNDQQKLRKAQLDVLQSQINPHFLYNTLDSIVWMSRDNRNMEVVDMVMALTKLLRISLSKGHELIPVEDELKHVESYLTIQGIRYKGKFGYEINVPEEAYRCYILKLTLQPIVENAIYHGIKNSLSKGFIRISCEIGEDRLHFIVEDTGVGIPPEKVAELNDMFSRIGEGSGVGLRNVNERIKIYFGFDYGLGVESVSGAGTKVVITIPMVSGGNYAEVADS